MLIQAKEPGNRAVSSSQIKNYKNWQNWQNGYNSL